MEISLKGNGSLCTLSKFWIEVLLVFLSDTCTALCKLVVTRKRNSPACDMLSSDIIGLQELTTASAVADFQ